MSMGLMAGFCCSAAGAYGNREPMTTYEEIWHSSELDLDVSITRTDPRWVGKRACLLKYRAASPTRITPPYRRTTRCSIIKLPPSSKQESAGSREDYRGSQQSTTVVLCPWEGLVDVRSSARMQPGDDGSRLD